MSEFTTPLDYEHVDILLLPSQKSDDKDHNPGDFKVHWSFDVVEREWGIHSVDVMVKRVEGTFLIEEDDGSETEHTFDTNNLEIADLDEGRTKWSIEIEMRKDFNFSISSIIPLDVSIDYNTKQVTVFF